MISKGCQDKFFKDKFMQKRFVQYIVLGVGALMLAVIGAWYINLIQIPGFPPPGCYYQNVQCIQAPCNPILVCNTSSIPGVSPVPNGTGETTCNSDNDCGVNICACKSIRKELIRTRDKICARYCPGEPKCINNQCVLEKIAEGKPCGGFAGEKGQYACPSGYKCQYPEPLYPDAQGKCVKL